jgi:hypothetical protein
MGNAAAVGSVQEAETNTPLKIKALRPSHSDIYLVLPVREKVAST